jgi:hypothetical protein
MIGMKVQKVSFDSRRVMLSAERAERLFLKKAGFAVRREAIGSIQDAPPDQAAPAGKPPHSHTKALRKRVNAKRGRGTNKAKKKGRDFGGGLGFPGIKYIQYALTGKRSVITGPASNRTRSITIPEALEEGKMGVEEHPFMGPALERVKPTMAPMWANSIKP